MEEQGCKFLLLLLGVMINYHATDCTYSLVLILAEPSHHMLFAMSVVGISSPLMLSLCYAFQYCDQINIFVLEYGCYHQLVCVSLILWIRLRLRVGEAWTYKWYCHGGEVTLGASARWQIIILLWGLFFYCCWSSLVLPLKLISNAWNLFSSQWLTPTMYSNPHGILRTPLLVSYADLPAWNVGTRMRTESFLCA